MGYARKMAGFLAALAVMFCVLHREHAHAQSALPATLYKVGMTQVEFSDPATGGRTLNFMLIYPATPRPAARPLKILLYSNLHLYKDAPPVVNDVKRPLIVFSHGAGGNGSGYAWFGEYLAARGYFVAMAYHYRANTYDTSALYVRNRIWQRPRDVSLDISYLLKDKKWGPRINPDQIGVAGHSQGGFTALWIAGAEINPDLFLAYQRGWKDNAMVPAYVRQEMIVDAKPALGLRDSRVKAVFAMAPGDVQGFGMDAVGLRRVAVPAYIIVGAGDTATPPKENAEFAARYIPQVQLDVLPGAVGHEIFGNECDQIGRDNFPEACNDAAHIDRTQLHEYIGSAALHFFDSTLKVQRHKAQ